MDDAPDEEFPPVWPRPPLRGYFAADLDELPRLPRHTELIDGSLVFASRRTVSHARALSRLERSLQGAAPAPWCAVRQMTLTLGPRDRLEPDVALVRSEACAGPSQTSFRPEDVLLTVEVVSPDSEARDRDTKPRKYAAAGIPHFWRVENNSGKPVVYVFEWEPATRTYVATGIHHEQLKVSEPFPVDIDLTETHARG